MATSPKTEPADRAHMRAALALAARGLGNVWPNPAVGCVLVRNDRVIARGWTQPGGRPHAETEALTRAGDAARSATAYVSLEPCAHHGKTPPCAQALIDAGIGRAVVAMEDPDPRVDGGGIDRLRQAGISVEVGLCREEAAHVNEGFLLRIREQRPLVTLKLASSLDGRIATHTGDSRWITGPEARARGHLLRAQNDAILVGSGTALTDDPDLTCRLPGMENRSPVRVVVDSRLRLPSSSKLAASAARVPTWLVTLPNADGETRKALEDRGIEIIDAPPGTDGRIDFAAALRELAGRGITRLLVEGGGGVAASLFRADLVDRLVWFRAPMVIGGDGKPGIEAFGVADLAAARRFERTGQELIGQDLLETYGRRA